jgi:hypothetical protein
MDRQAFEPDARDTPVDRDPVGRTLSHAKPWRPRAVRVRRATAPGRGS